MTDTERLDWCIARVMGAEEALQKTTLPDKMMGITAFGEVTNHDEWYWPLDGTNQAYATYRDAIDAAMKKEK